MVRNVVDVLAHHLTLLARLVKLISRERDVESAFGWCVEGKGKEHNWSRGRLGWSQQRLVGADLVAGRDVDRCGLRAGLLEGEGGGQGKGSGSEAYMQGLDRHGLPEREQPPVSQPS